MPDEPIPKPTETAPKRERPLTLKQQKWIDAYIQTGGNATEAARQAGYCAEAANGYEVIGHENLRKLKSKLEDILDKHGLTLDTAAKATADALQANTVRVAIHEGRIADEREYADHSTRLAAARQVFQLRGAFKENTVNVNVSYGLGAIELDPEFDALEIEAEEGS